MNREALSYFTETHLIIIAMGLFLACFLGSLIWTNLKANQEKYKYMAGLPLAKGGKDE